MSESIRKIFSTLNTTSGSSIGVWRRRSLAGAIAILLFAAPAADQVIDAAKQIGSSSLVSGVVAYFVLSVVVYALGVVVEILADASFTLISKIRRPLARAPFTETSATAVDVNSLLASMRLSLSSRAGVHRAASERSVRLANASDV